MIKLRSQSGFGLVELAVVGFLTALLSLMMNRLLINSLAGAKAVQAKTDMESLATNIKLIVENEATCPSSLVNARSTPTSAYFNPLGTVSDTDKLNAVVQNGSRVVQVGQTFPTVTILEMTLYEKFIARTPYGAGTRYVVMLKVKAVKIGAGLAGAGGGAFFSGQLTEEVPLWVATDATHQIVACGGAGGGSGTHASQFISEPLKFEKVIDLTPGQCDGNAGGECYCGGLETVHRATTDAAGLPLNATGSPYDHVNNPAHNERPRKWVAELSCPPGYVMGAVGADCAKVSGKLENITPTSPTRAMVSCCAYTPDGTPVGDTRPGGVATAVCYKL